MKSLFKHLVITLLVALCTGFYSCNSKVYTPDVDVKVVNSIPYIYYQSKLFNGTVYSSDESCYVVVENGMLVKVVAFHPNGTTALEATISNSKFIRIWYDENGNKIEEFEFKKNYKDLVKSVNHKLPID